MLQFLKTKPFGSFGFALPCAVMKPITALPGYASRTDMPQF